MDKLLTYSVWEQATGPHVFPLYIDNSRSMIKMARPMPARVQSYIQNAKPIPNRAQLLIDSMGADEFWGSNVNGDTFPEEALRHPGQDYGFQTFETNAYPYKHHVNKDPAAAYGDRVSLSEYDPYMHRVLLIVAVDDKKCQDILSDLARGIYWSVSMGCFTGETLVSLEDGTRVPIEQIKVGDMVLTHLGRARRVKSIHRRQYKGVIHSIKASAHEIVRCTTNHPWLTVHADDLFLRYRKSNRRRRDDVKSISPEWTHAHHLASKEEFLLEPVLSETITPDYVTRSFARLLGYYLAKGHLLRNKQKKIIGIELSVHRDDPVHAEIESLCKDFDTENAPVTTARRGIDAFSRTISIFDQRLAELCYEHAGGYAKQKRLSLSAMHWDPEMQREMFGAYANGDGCEKSPGVLSISTASTFLAWQFMTLLPRFGVVPSICNLNHKAGTGFSHHATQEWVVHIGKQFAQALRDVCAKISEQPIHSKQVTRWVMPVDEETSHVITPIKAVTSLYAEIPVFNLEVEEDESFLVSGMAVHNCRVPFDVCSICGNRAKNRAQYCAHLRTQMNQILPDGRRVCAINTLPKFFDISFVTIGAEKASHVLQKVASAGLVPHVGSAEAWDKHAALKAATEKKTADIDKKIPSSPPAVIRPLDVGTKDVLTDVMDAAGEAKRKERPLTPETLDALAASPEALRDILATLAVLGVDLHPQEFQRLALSKLGHAKLAGDLWRTRTVFDESKPSLVVPSWAQDFGVHPAFVSQKVAGLVAPYLVDRSCHDDILAGRLAKLADSMVYHRDNAWYPQTPDEKQKSSGMPGIVPASLGLAAAFMAFKRLFPDLGKNAPLPLRILVAHPWLLPLLVGAGVGARVGFQTMTAPPSLGSARIERPLDAMQGPDYDGQAQEKTASIKSSLLQLGLIPLTYIYAGVQQRRWERGEKLNAVDRLIARRPDLASIATVALAPHFATGIKGLAKHGASAPCSTTDSLIFRGLQRFTR